MIIDARNEFADAEGVDGSAGTALIGDVIDLEVVGRDPGNGTPVYLVMTVDTSIITAGAAGTITFALASDAAAAIATNGSATVHWQSQAFVTDGDDANALDAGDVIAVVALPVGFPAYERYVGILATIATTAVTAGKINAFLTCDPHGWKAYADAVN